MADNFRVEWLLKHCENPHANYKDRPEYFCRRQYKWMINVLVLESLYLLCRRWGQTWLKRRFAWMYLNIGHFWQKMISSGLYLPLEHFYLGFQHPQFVKTIWLKVLHLWKVRHEITTLRKGLSSRIFLLSSVKRLQVGDPREVHCSKESACRNMHANSWGTNQWQALLAVMI